MQTDLQKEYLLTRCQGVLSTLSKWLGEIEELDDADCSALSFILHMVNDTMSISKTDHID